MKIHLIACTLACFTFVGCSKKDVQVSEAWESSEPIVMDELPPVTDLGGHPEHGPHGGELIELGTHEELLVQGGRYAALTAAWAKSQPV